MAIVLFDNHLREQLFPLTLTRAVADLRCGILTFKERWELISKQPVFISSAGYLQPLYKTIVDTDNIWIDACVIADEELTNKILSLKKDEALVDEKGLVAGRTNIFLHQDSVSQFSKIIEVKDVKRLEFTFQIFQWNDLMIREDFKLLTSGRTSQPISHTNQVVYQDDIFIEEGASVEFAILNSTSGPIYIGKDTQVWEGTAIRGPFALGENALLKMGTKIYGATSIGPNCAVGGEVKNVVMIGHSNKAHDGYLGDSVIGEWCNLGAGTSNSNVKNTGGEVKLWNHYTKEFLIAGNKCGVIMGDYSRVAINSCINTGSVIGVCANVYGAGLLPKVIDDFSWGIDQKYDFDKALDDINNWKKMKHKEITEAEKFVLKYIFDTK
ncbi:MAG TPA: putative sugar nucleotidyl transferase [Chitinophagaceae bacterium]|nr:putative sugar nucleotidyl transferase [Chitinophagaceae bacterium]